MRLVTKFMAGIAGSMLMAGTAMAADPPTPPPPPPPPMAAPVVNPAFHGLYIGGFLGYGVGNKFWDNTPYGGWGTATHTVRGLLVGVEGGFRFQTGALAFGVEGDWAWTNINGISDPCNAGVVPWACATDLDWLATLTGTFGFVPGGLGGNILIYVEGGLALADENFAVLIPPALPFLTGSIINRGWVVGGGAVFALANGLYVKGEYNFINFGTDVAVIVDNFGFPPVVPFDLTQRLHTFKLGVGFQF